MNKDETWYLRYLSIPSDNLKPLNVLFPRISLDIVLVLECYWITQNKDITCRFPLGKTSHKESGKRPTYQDWQSPITMNMSTVLCWDACHQEKVFDLLISNYFPKTSLAWWIRASAPPLPELWGVPGRSHWWQHRATVVAGFGDIQLSHHSCGKEDQKDATLFSGRGLQWNDP